MGRGGKHAGDRILAFGCHARATLAAAALGAIGGQGRAFDIAAMGDGDDHVLARDEVFILHIRIAFDNRGSAWNGKSVAHSHQFLANDRHDLFARGEDFQIPSNRLGQGAGFFKDFVAAKTG